MIAPTELTHNYERLNAMYDPNQPIETLFEQIQDARAFAVAGGQPYGAAMIVNVAYTLVFNTGFFPDACRDWQSRAIAGKTWAQFKLDFATAHCEFRITNQTAHQSGFHSANMMIEQGLEETMQDTVDEIAQLATATASDRGTGATLTTTNAKLATQLSHAACFSPVKSTWITAIKNGHFISWSGLTEHAVEKHSSKSTSTIKGHLNQQRQNTRTTKVKDPQVIMTEPDLDQGIKTQHVYAARIDA
jgi:hypothetical protein